MKKITLILLSFIISIFFGFSQQIPNCSELFISEYLEGTAKNRVIEIYNPAAEDVDLSIYSIKVFASGPNNPNVMPLSGFLGPKEVLVCGHDQADSGILLLCDLTSAQLKFDGDDAVGLYKNNLLIDMIGQIGVNPGNTGWQVGAGFTKDNTLRRGYDVKGPTAFWTQSQFEWDVLPIDDISGLGDNDNVCFAATIQFVFAGSNNNEGSGTKKLLFTVHNPFTFPLAGRISHNPNTANCIDPELATRNEDYETTQPQAFYIDFPIPADTTWTGFASIFIIDDDLHEPEDEAICFELVPMPNLSPNPAQDKNTMMIIDNDPPTGVNELNGNNINIYPSVADKYLSIEGVPDGAGISVSVYNVFGQKVISKHSDIQQGNMRVRIEYLAPGMYVLALESLKGTITKKFIKN